MRIGSYEIVTKIGEGGAGAVFRARSQEGREVALKLLRPRKGKEREDELQRFERERRLLSAFGEREGFVPLLDSGSGPNGVYLVMPLVPGGTLRDRMPGPFGIDETVELGRALASALARAHERGIVHRDVKPENVLFTRRSTRLGQSGQPLLVDLGLAKHFQKDGPTVPGSASLSKTGEVRGTLGYAAPEQLVDSKSVGPQADVFALGAVLYECLTGAQPVPGSKLLATLRPEAPSWLVRAIERSLDMEPGRRFEDGAAFLRALEARSVAPAAKVVLGVLALVVPGTIVLAIWFSGEKEPQPVPVTEPSKPRATPVPTSKKPRESATPQPKASLQPAEVAELEDRAEKELAAGEYDQAIADSTRAAELAPKLAQAWRTRAEAKLRKGDPRGALADSSRAVDADPNYALGWNSRAAARFATGDYEGALADESRAVEVDPKYTAAWVNRAVLRTSRGDLEGAIQDATRAIDLNPDLAPAWHCRGIARSGTHDLDGALSDLDRAIELNPGSSDAWTERARVRLEKGDLDLVISDASRAIELDPKIPRAWSLRGAARLKKGDTASARADYEQFLVLSPNDGDAPRIRKWLAETPR